MSTPPNAHHHQRTGAETLGLLGHRVGLRLVAAGVDDHVGAVAGQLEKNRPPDIPPRARDQCGLTAIPKSSLSLTPYVPIYRSEADKGAHSAAREQSENFASGTPWE